MPSVGVKELKNSASQIVEDIREDGKSYTIICDEKPVAIILPLEKKLDPWEEDFEPRKKTTLEELRKLTAEIPSRWVSEMTSLEILNEVRQLNFLNLF